MERNSKNVIAKYVTIGLVRIMGIAMMAIGFAILLNGFAKLPAYLGYILVSVGFLEFIVMPIFLARVWKSDDKKDNAGIEKS